MPTISPSVTSSIAQKDEAIRVLVTGFGPFAQFKENPSWLAVSKLHNVILEPDEGFVDIKEDTTYSDKEGLPIHITALKVPVVYSSVLSIVPGLHARPPVLPDSDIDDLAPTRSPPEDGYDFVFHVGVAGPGKMRVEMYGHKYGYRLPDVKGEFAPIVSQGGQDSTSTSAEEAREAERLGSKGTELDNPDVIRGFAKGYEQFPELLQTKINGEELVEYLHGVGVDQVCVSTDAGHYLCDFINYCSLAEATRTASSLPEGGKSSKALFLHCPPVDQPLSTDDVALAIKLIIGWVCRSSRP